MALFISSMKIQKRTYNMLTMNEAHPTKVAPRLQLLRGLRNLKQTELCDLLDIQKNTYNHYERGQNRPDVSNALKLCAFYGVTLDYLFSGNIAGLPHHMAIEITKAEADITPSDRKAL